MLGTMVNISDDDAVRFFDKVLIGDGCWEWQAGGTSGFGYGKFRVDGKSVNSHTFSWEFFNGERNGMCVMHKCDNPPCVNPKHLKLGTKADNSRDMVSKRRNPVGEERHNSKLTEKKVLEIRASSDRHCDIADQYGIARSTVFMIKNRRTWRHI